jgi:hypothetical protein
MMVQTVHVTILNLVYTQDELPHALAEHVAMFRDVNTRLDLGKFNPFYRP